MKKFAFLASIILIIVAIYVLVGPYLTISAIKTAVIQRDTEKLSENINFPLLRQNLKDQINVAVVKSVGSDLKDNPFAVLAVGLAAKMVDGIVDTFFTPSGLAALMEGKEPHGSKSISKDAQPVERKDLFKNARYTYDSMSRFSIWAPTEDGKEIRFILKREGLKWRLVNIIIPLEDI